jgi:flavin-dependent dehydrogenase
MVCGETDVLADVLADVLIVGAGPAGAVAALNLAPTRRVIVCDARAEPCERIGESLPPAARRLLRDMGLLESFEAEGHAPCYGNRSVWGDAAPQETDFLRDPDGPGWHLDRARFENWLRAIAADRGAILRAPARLKTVTQAGSGWQATLATIDGEVAIHAAFLIDAGGRAAPAARQVGAQVKVSDRLICISTYGDDERPGNAPGLTYVEAEETGWWYTAPLPNGRRVLAFHTDADLPSARLGPPSARREKDPQALLERARTCREFSALLDSSAFRPDGQCSFQVAHSAVLDRYTGDGWLATGDAAMSFDPLSAQGLLNALFTGLAAATAADGYLSGERDALQNYEQLLTQVWQLYREHLTSWYSAETRWPDSLFWQRRQVT